MKKNGVFLFVISHLVPEIFKIFVLCKIGTDDVIIRLFFNNSIFHFIGTLSTNFLECLQHDVSRHFSCLQLTF